MIGSLWVTKEILESACLHSSALGCSHMSLCGAFTCVLGISVQILMLHSKYFSHWAIPALLVTCHLWVYTGMSITPGHKPLSNNDAFRFRNMKSVIGSEIKCFSLSSQFYFPNEHSALLFLLLLLFRKRADHRKSWLSQLINSLLCTMYRENSLWVFYPLFVHPFMNMWVVWVTPQSETFMRYNK